MLQIAQFAHAADEHDHHAHQNEQSICQICINLDSFKLTISDFNKVNILSFYNKIKYYHNNIFITHDNYLNTSIRAPPLFS